MIVKTPPSSSLGINNNPFSCYNESDEDLPETWMSETDGKWIFPDFEFSSYQHDYNANSNFVLHFLK